MEVIIELIFIFNISLIIIHEMDAVWNKEWKMFIILENLKEELGYKIFTLAHLPIYMATFYWILYNRNNINLYLIIDILFIAHTVVHWSFIKNKNNGFKTLFSNMIINIIGIGATLHLFCLYILK